MEVLRYLRHIVPSNMILLALTIVTLAIGLKFNKEDNSRNATIYLISNISNLKMSLLHSQRLRLRKCKEILHWFYFVGSCTSPFHVFKFRRQLIEDAPHHFQTLKWQLKNRLDNHTHLLFRSLDTHERVHL